MVALHLSPLPGISWGSAPTSVIILQSLTHCVCYHSPVADSLCLFWGHSIQAGRGRYIGLVGGQCCCCAVQWHDNGFASEVFGLCQSNPQRSCALLLDLCPEIMCFTCSFVSSDHMLCSVCLCPLFTVLCLRVSHCSLMYI